MTASEDGPRPLVQLGVRLVIVGLTLTAAAALYGELLKDHQPPSDKPLQVRLMDPPEPPPPPEKPEMEEPEAAEPEVEIQEPDEPRPVEDLPPPLDDSLGLDAEGVAGSDAFGLKAKKGGRSLLSLADGSGMDPRWAAYASALESRLQEHLSGVESLRGQAYRVELHLWIDGDGRVTHCDFTRGTGRTALDEEIRTSLLQGCRVPETQPPGLPQPVRLRIDSRAAGKRGRRD